MSGLATSLGTALPAMLAGAAMGWLHFRSLRAVTDRLVAGRLSAVVLQAARLLALAIFFVFCARMGAAPLLAAGAGVLAGRAFVLHRLKRGVP